jgi:hypothetical protein
MLGNTRPLPRASVGCRAAVLIAFGFCFAATILGSPVPAASAEPSAVAPATPCEGLLFTDFTNVPDAPTRITSAEMATANGAKPFCKITGYVAPQVGFELHLPSEGWSQRLVFTGCGGLCGWIHTDVEQSYGCSPIENGSVALVASNLGHIGWNPGDGVWANGNPAARVDFGYRGRMS